MALMHIVVAVAIFSTFLTFLVILCSPVRTAANAPCSTKVLTAATLLVTLASVPTLLAFIQNARLAGMVVVNAVAVLPALTCLLLIACSPICTAAYSTLTAITRRALSTLTTALASMPALCVSVQNTICIRLLGYFLQCFLSQSMHLQQRCFIL
jgi:hypothetical protein